MTCGTCIYNDDLLCDRYGRLVEDDDEACRGYIKENMAGKEKYQDAEENSGEI